MAVTVTLKDAQNNPLTGASSLLDTNTVTVPDAIPKSGSTWQDNGNGTYSATYTAQTAGAGLKATLHLSDWSSNVESTPYDIVVVTIKDILVNGYTFDKDAGFPTTGFNLAKFTIELNGALATDYTWASSAAWVSVDASATLSGYSPAVLGQWAFADIVVLLPTVLTPNTFAKVAKARL